MPRPKSAILSDKEQKLVDAKMSGLSDTAALKAAGITNTNSTSALRTQRVKEALAHARTDVRSASSLSRLDVIEGIMEAIDMARQMAEPGTMINGYDKLAKIIGAYEPETKKIEVSLSGEYLLHRMERMSSEELLAIAEGRMTIEGEYVPVN